MPLYAPAIQTVMDPWGTHECRLDWNSTTSVKLSRFGGQWLMINGVRRSIPAAGIIADFTGVASGNYYVYASWTGSAIAIWVAGGSYANDAYGMPILNGDPNAVLLGLVCWQGAGGMPNHGYMCSYWNRKPRAVAGVVSNVQSQSTSWVNIGGNIVFTAFAGESYEAYLGGTGWGLGVDALIVQTCLAIDAGLIGIQDNICPRFNGWYCPIGQRLALNLPAGDTGHTIMAYGAINTNGGGAYTGQWLLHTGVRWLG